MQLFFFVDKVMIKGDGFTLQEQSWDSTIDSTLVYFRMFDARISSEKADGSKHWS